MKVLLVFPDWLGYSGYSIKKAFENSKHKCMLYYDFNYNYLKFSGRLRSSLRRLKLISNYFLVREKLLVNRKLIRVANKFKPELVIINNPSLYEVETFNKLKKNKYLKLICWIADNPHYFRNFDMKISFFDYILIGNRNWKIFGSLENKKFDFLPYGYDPNLFYPIENQGRKFIKYNCDVCFLGARYRDREVLLSKLSDVDLKIYGWKRKNFLKEKIKEIIISKNINDPYEILNTQEIKTLESKISSNRYISPWEANDIYNGSRIVLNIQHPQMKDMLNSKFFEISGSGAFQLINSNIRDKEFKDVITTFDENKTAELKNKINYFIKNEKEREEIASELHKIVLRNHRWEDRINYLLEKIYSI